MSLFLTRYLLALSALWLVEANAFAHARWKLGSAVSPPRTNDTGLKTGPCGGVPRTKTPRAFTPGQTITVEWEETINHPGYYRISFSPKGEQGFDDAANILVPNFADTQDTPVNAGAEHQYTTTVTLPTALCTDCTLQLIQFMTENPANPGMYFSCSDIQITADGKVVPPPATPPAEPAGKEELTKPSGLKINFKK